MPINRTTELAALRVTLSTGAATGTVPSGLLPQNGKGRRCQRRPDPLLGRGHSQSEVPKPDGRQRPLVPHDTSARPARTTATPMSRREVAPLPYKKRAIPQAVRREVCIRAGAVFGQNIPIKCAYCPHVGVVVWRQRTYGWPSIGGDLELDHVIPERHGGPSTADNIVLACRRCNRRKGSKL